MYRHWIFVPVEKIYGASEEKDAQDMAFREEELSDLCELFNIKIAVQEMKDLGYF